MSLKRPLSDVDAPTPAPAAKAPRFDDYDDGANRWRVIVVEIGADPECTCVHLFHGNEAAGLAAFRELLAETIAEDTNIHNAGYSITFRVLADLDKENDNDKHLPKRCRPYWARARALCVKYDMTHRTREFVTIAMKCDVFFMLDNVY